jgi:6-phosphogluconolactonase
VTAFRPGIARPMIPAMPLTRRDFLASAALGAAASTLRARGASASVPGAAADPWQLYVGTYTGKTGSRGVYRMTADRTTGALHVVGVAAELEQPSFLALAPDGRSLYAVNELVEYEGRASGALTALAREPGTQALTARGRRASEGGAPCYVSVDRTGRHALVANYVGGNVAVFPVGADGVGAPTALVHHAGRGPNARRQEGPHAHCIVLDPANRFALAADLGIDRVRVYRFDAAAGTLAPAAVPEVALRPGAGPRHLAFAPDGRTVYVVNELDSTLVAFDYDAPTGRLRERQTLSTRPAGAPGDNYPADLHVHPNGRTVYASNRGDDTIAVVAVAPDGGRLSLAQTVPTGGKWPRNFALDPAGRLLLVANERSGSVVAFGVDAATGRLAPTGARAEVPAPVCLVFVAPG